MYSQGDAIYSLSCLYIDKWIGYDLRHRSLIEKSNPLRALLIGGWLASCSSLAVATPWVGTLDPQLHNDLVTLTEYRVLHSVVNTYPVPWKGIAQQIQQLNTDSLPHAAQMAAMRLKHYLQQQQMRKSKHYVSVYGATEHSRFTAFDGEQRPSARLSQTNEWTEGSWSAQLTVNLETAGETNLDQSYVAYQYKDWTLAVTALDQWWGPAHSSSLILTDNARPVPSVSLSRATTAAPKTSWLKWLGSWYFTAQVGQMEGDRTVPDVRLWRTRFTFQPIEGLELGASWAAMWGGEGKPNGLGDFIDVITFRKECANGADSCDPELNTTIGNHIAGFDAKYSFILGGMPISVYAQRVGEDAVDGYRVTDNANLFGISTYIAGAKFYIESSDTNIACAGDGSTATNCYYESGLYPDGYRRYGRALGSTFDSDAKHLTVGTSFHPSAQDTISIQVSRIELNPDGTRPSPVLTDSIEEQLWYLSGHYQTVWRDWQVKLGANIGLREFTLEPREDETDLNGYLHVRYAF